MGNTPIYQYDW